MAYTLGIIGYGGMGSWHHRSIAEKVKAIRVAGAFDIQEEALEKARAAGIRAYETQQALLEDPSIDIVTIATPNNFHKDIAIAAMRKGKHVICEKPVTMNAAELQEVIACAQETKRLFSVHQNRRWDKDYRIVKQVLDAGEIGKPYFIESRVQGSRGAMHGWRGYKVNGGGMLLDWGVHLIDQMMQLIPEAVVSVEAHLLSVFTPEVEDNIKLLLRFANGVSALLEMSTNCLIPLPRWHVSAEGGTLVVEDWKCNGRIVRLREGGEVTWEDDIVYTEAGPTRTMAPRPVHTMEETPLPQVNTDWADYYRNIADVLDKKAELLVRPEEALRVMRVIDLLFASASEGCGKACNI